MTSRDPDLSYGADTEAMRFILDQTLKRVHTAIPGVVLSYDTDLRRATVQPGANLLLSDGSTMARPPIANVPILWPSAGGFTLRFPLPARTAVMILYSERDISAFKQTLTAGPLASDRIMADSDAVAIVGFGPVGAVTEAAADGVSLQTDDGDTAVIVEEGHITLRADQVTIDYAGGTVEWP